MNRTYFSPIASRSSWVPSVMYDDSGRPSIHSDTITEGECLMTRGTTNSAWSLNASAYCCCACASRS